ncbi:sigma factor [Streptomyces synnematoformans]|uniref:RNA polymerase sigma factor SigJ n=1 Tax=Streptomyces synnematoformans TaxID=415721 RepID=A0ABN2XKH5_9ACTN
METQQRLAEQFEEERPQLSAVAYRMLGSLSEAEDAVQESWFRLSRADVSEVRNLAAWLTTVVSRVCLDMLRTRQSRREEPLDVHLPDPVVTAGDGMDPEAAALAGDSVGWALLVVLDTLAPAERLAFVLHDMFAVPFDDIAPIVERTPAATRKLASRARGRVAGRSTTVAPDLGRQRDAVEAFYAAAGNGDFDALLAVLDPDVVLRADTGAALAGAAKLRRGAKEVAAGAMLYRRPGAVNRPAVVAGAAGAVTYVDGKPVSVTAFTVTEGRITHIDILSDPVRLAALPLPPLP